MSSRMVVDGAPTEPHQRRRDARFAVRPASCVVRLSRAAAAPITSVARSSYENAATLRVTVTSFWSKSSRS